MNFESARWRRDAVEGEVLDAETVARRSKRRRIIIAFVVLVVAALIAFVLFGGNSSDQAAPAAGEAGQETTAPNVTVIIPGSQQIARTINASGSLAARRDLPVGVAGEGGMVARVLVEPGQWVDSGQTLAVIERSVQSQQAQQLAASIEVARADAALAQNELDRALQLVDRGFVSKADVDRKRAARDAAAARVRVAQAQLRETQARIGRLDIRAPASGLVLDRNVEAGQVVGGGSGALFRIAQGGQMEMVARMTQEDLATVSEGVPATVTPVGSDQSYEGSVWQVSPIIDPETRQGEVRIAIPYAPDLRPGGFANAAILTGSADAPLLPESAVLNDDRGSYVYIVGNDNTVARRDVTIGRVTDEGVVISSGLSGNERVVASAGAFLNPGDKVNPRRMAAER